MYVRMRIKDAKMHKNAFVGYGWMLLYVEAHHKTCLRGVINVTNQQSLIPLMYTARTKCDFFMFGTISTHACRRNAPLPTTKFVPVQL